MDKGGSFHPHIHNVVREGAELEVAFRIAQSFFYEILMRNIAYQRK